MAVCYQKMGSLEECSIALENSLIYLDNYYSLSDKSIAKRMKLMQQEWRIRIQLCALFSQLHQHKDALEQAKNSTKLVHCLIKDLLTLWDFYTKKKQVKDKSVIFDDSILAKNRSKSKNNRYIEPNESQGKLIVDDIFDTDEDEKQYNFSPLKQASIHNYLEEELSLIERTAQRVKPIIEILWDRLVKEKKIDECNYTNRKNNDLDNEDKSKKKINKVVVFYN